MTAVSLEWSSAGHFSVQRQVEGEFDIEVSVREFRSATQGAVGVELLSWFCFIIGQEAGLALTGVELIRN